MVARNRPKAEERHIDPIKKKQAEAGRKANVRGKSEERTLVKKIASWWDPEGKYEWRRTPASGGSPLKEGFDLAGDVCTTSPDFPFHIEIKKDLRFDKIDKFFTADKWAFWEFIEQAEDDCPRHRYPILIVMKPGPSQPKFVAMWRSSAHKPMIYDPSLQLEFVDKKVNSVNLIHGVIPVRRRPRRSSPKPSVVKIFQFSDFIRLDKEIIKNVFSVT